MKHFIFTTVVWLVIFTHAWAQNPPFETDTLQLGEQFALLTTTFYKKGVYPPEITIEIVEAESFETRYIEQGAEFERGFVSGVSYFDIGGHPTALVEFQPYEKAKNSGNGLLMLSPTPDTVYRSVLYTRGYFEVLNLDTDSENELLITEHLFNRLNVRGCMNQLFPDPRFSGKLLPDIYEWNRGNLRLISEEKALAPYYEQYIKHLEETFSADTARYINHYKDYSKPQIPTLLDYAQYFYVCKAAGKKRKYPLQFFQQNDKLFMYVCRDVPGRSFTLNTSLSRFFEQFGKEIILAEER